MGGDENHEHTCKSMSTIRDFRFASTKPRPRIKRKFTVKRKQVLIVIMPRITLLAALAFIGLVAIFICEAYGFQNSPQDKNLYNNIKLRNTLVREKRQLETFDDEYAPSSNQNTPEEPSFWDRVVKTALKLFNKFIEWLNS